MSGPTEAVRRRAGNRCEYCHLPQVAFRRGFHIEHIVARQHGGPTSLDNRARTNGRNIFPRMSAPSSRSVSKSAD